MKWILGALLILAPMASACSPLPPPIPVDFSKASVEDGVVYTDLGFDKIRIDLETGVYEKVGNAPQNNYGGWLPSDFESHGTKVDYQFGNVCCLCGPYVVGVHLAVDGQTVARFGEDDDPDQDPVDAFRAQASDDILVVYEGMESKLTLVELSKPTSRQIFELDYDGYRWPSFMFLDKTAYFFLDQQELLAVNTDGLTSYDMPMDIERIQKIIPGEPPIIVGYRWLARIGDSGLEDIVTTQAMPQIVEGEDAPYVYAGDTVYRYTDSLEPVYTAPDGTFTAHVAHLGATYFFARDDQNATGIARIAGDTTWLTKDFSVPHALWSDRATEDEGQRNDDQTENKPDAPVGDKEIVPETETTADKDSPGPFVLLVIAGLLVLGRRLRF